MESAPIDDGPESAAPLADDPIVRAAVADIRRRLTQAVGHLRPRTLPLRWRSLRPLVALYERAVRPQQQAIAELADAQAAIVALIELLAARRP